mmetsp:Transcript_51984/g.149848  ORF Transcript_51984/g.149848 Transcript_51984/m.149848 type:complete len:322 (+) Transcript_51984:871-1836(+)
MQSLDLVTEVLLLVIIELLVILGRTDVQLVLRLRLRRLEWASQDSHLGILHHLWHLGVTEVLVHNDALDQTRIFQLSANLSLNLDQIEVDIRARNIGDGQDRVYANPPELVLAAADDFRAKGRARGLAEGRLVVGHDVDLACDLLDLLHGDLARLLEAGGDAKRMDAFLDEPHRLLKHGACHDDDARGAVADLVVLRLRQVDEELRDVVRHVHLLQDRGAIVGHEDVPVGADDHLVHALGTHGAAHRLRDGLRREDVRLMRIDPLQALLPALLLEDDERVPVLIHGELAHRHRHGARVSRRVRPTHRSTGRVPGPPTNQKA